MSKSYAIVREAYTYTYRSYMACEDQGPDDCVGTGYTYKVMNKRGTKVLREFSDLYSAQVYVRKLRKILRKKKALA